MQKSQVGRYFLTGLTVLVLMILLALLSAIALRFYASPFLEMAWNWSLRLVGLATVVYSVTALLAAGPASLAPDNFSRGIALALLGMLIIHQSWFITLGLVALLIAMMVLACLKNSGRETDSAK